MAVFTAVHVLISLVGIVSGLVVLTGLLASNPMNAWSAVFLATTAATSLTGFGFPYNGVTPGIVLGVLSLAVLAVAIAARYVFVLSGAWRWIYVIAAIVALYFNFFVLIVQSFLKVPALHALAPQGSEPPFAIAQGIALLFFVASGILAVRRFRPSDLGATGRSMRLDND